MHVGYTMYVRSLCDMVYNFNRELFLYMYVFVLDDVGKSMLIPARVVQWCI